MKKALLLLCFMAATIVCSAQDNAIVVENEDQPVKLYHGINNVLKISVKGYADKDVVVTMDSAYGTIVRGEEEGNYSVYQVRVASYDVKTVRVNVDVKVGRRLKHIGTKEYDVDVPSAMLALGRRFISADVRDKGTYTLTPVTPTRYVLHSLKEDLTKKSEILETYFGESEQPEYIECIINDTTYFLRLFPIRGRSYGLQDSTMYNMMGCKFVLGDVAYEWKGNRSGRYANLFYLNEIEGLIPAIIATKEEFLNIEVTYRQIDGEEHTLKGGLRINESTTK